MIERILDDSRTVAAACAVSLAAGLFFIFVWAPHPWGWQSFDRYHEIAIELAQGRPFPTMDVPWAYAYFVAGFYALFGVRPWVPLVMQAILNAAMPALVFALAQEWFDRRTAALAAVLTGVCSFNTIYASTESSDALCTVVFVAAILVFTRAMRTGSSWRFAAVGLLTGVAFQLRPNLVLVPLVLAAYMLWIERGRRQVVRAAVLVACAALAVTPWVVRNYSLTRELLPTSVHGPVQLWYGTLQVGPYLESRAHNPRSVFEAPTFEYTSLTNVPVEIGGSLACTTAALESITLVYWSDIDRTPRRLAGTRGEGTHYRFEIPPVGSDAVLYYYFVARWTEGEATVVRTTPPEGEAAPFVYFVSTNHLGDLDRDGDLLDVFDVIRLLRREAWNEPVPFRDELDRVGAVDARTAATVLIRPVLAEDADAAVATVGWDDARATVTFSDGSSIAVPRSWRGRITDAAFSEGIATTLMTSHVAFRKLAAALPPKRLSIDGCGDVGDLTVNAAFYRREPHMMRRYSALAADNIRRDPVSFALASLYRAGRIFVIQGATDRFTAQQFTNSGKVYLVATIASLVWLPMVAVGIAIAWRANRPIGLPLLLIAYIPATLAPVLTNMRYTVTVQPLMFMFAAIAIMTLVRRFRPEPDARRLSSGARTLSRGDV